MQLTKGCYVKPGQLAVVLFALTIPACRTPGVSTVKDDGPGGSPLYCSFLSPLNSGETYEVWATPSDGSQLTGVSERYWDGRNPPTDIFNVGTAQSVSVASISQNGSVKFRAYFKNIVSVNNKRFSCFNVDPGDNPSHQGYLCLGNVDSGGGAAGLWVTRNSSMKFLTDYTVYPTTCGAPPAG